MTVDPDQGQPYERKHARVLVRHAVDINGKPGGQAIDLSIDGMYINTRSAFSRGSSIHLAFQIEGVPIQTKAFVLYTHSGLGMGVRFQNLTLEDTGRIKEYLAGLSEAGQTQASDERKNVLIIEDTGYYQRVYQHRLLEAGFSALVAKNGIEGLKLASEKRPDMIILDLVMEGMDGYKVLSTLKGDPSLRHIPVVVLSVKAATKEADKAVRMGAAEYLNKSTTNPNQVIRKIKEILQSSEK